MLPQAPCSSTASGAEAPFDRGTIPPGQDELVMATNQFHSNTLLSSLQRAELTLTSLSCPHRTLRKCLAVLQPLLYGTGTSELMFHKVATKLEGKLPC